MVPRLFDVAHSGNVDQLMSLLQNGDNVNPMVRMWVVIALLTE